MPNSFLDHRRRHRQAERRGRPDPADDARHQRRQDADSSAAANSPTEAAFLYTGSGRILVDGVTVTSADKDGQPLAMNAQGRPYIVVSARGRFDATDSTLSDLGVQPTGHGQGRPRHLLQHRHHRGAGAHAAAAQHHRRRAVRSRKNIKLEGVTATESWSDGLLLQGDMRHDADGHQGRAQRRQRRRRDRRELGRRDPRHHHHRQPLLRGGRGRPDQGSRSTTSHATGDGAGGLRINRCTDCVVRDVTDRRTSRSACSCT